MPAIETRRFGVLTYSDAQVIHFGAGLPGFETCQDFLLHEEPSLGLFLFLQSVTDPNLSFVTLPVERLEENYELTLSRDDLAQLGLESLPEPAAVLCLAVLQVKPQGASANLAAPIVIHRTARLGTQAIRQDRRYSAQQPVVWGEAKRPEGGQ